MSLGKNYKNFVTGSFFLFCCDAVVMLVWCSWQKNYRRCYYYRRSITGNCDTADDNLFPVSFTAVNSLYSVLSTLVTNICKAVNILGNFLKNLKRPQWETGAWKKPEDENLVTDFLYNGCGRKIFVEIKYTVMLKSRGWYLYQTPFSSFMRQYLKGLN
jgi:hypothetical protein